MKRLSLVSLIPFKLLLTFDPILVEKVAILLNEIIQDNPNVSRLYLTGVFYFIMMYTGSNVLPVSRFLKYTHLKQAFRSDEVRKIILWTCLDLINKSILQIVSRILDFNAISDPLYLSIDQ